MSLDGRPRPENARADTNMGGAELSGDGVVSAHAHADLREIVARRNFREQGEMRRGIFILRRNAHQAGCRQAEFIPALV